MCAAECTGDRCAYRCQGSHEAAVKRGLVGVVPPVVTGKTMEKKTRYPTCHYICIHNIYIYIFIIHTYIFLYRDLTYKVGWTTKYLPVLKHGAWTCPLSMGIEAQFFYSRRWSGCSCWRSIEQSLGGFDRWFGVKSLAVLSMGDLQDPKMEVLYHFFGHILWGYSLA